MPLPHDYSGAGCSLARSLEVLGERWTFLIVRDAFYGARRFGDFADHLGIPRSVLTKRLEGLVADGVLEKTAPAARGYAEYELTPKGRELWPVVHGLMAWGDGHYAADGPPRVFEHAADRGRLQADGTCLSCGRLIAADETQVVPGPGLEGVDVPPNSVNDALRSPHRLLVSIHD